MTHPDLSQASMFDLFRLETAEQVQVLTTSLLALERDPLAAGRLESCMRAAHSLKGAARIVGIDAGVKLAHMMENCFVAAQKGLPPLGRAQIDELLRAVDLLRRIAQTPESELGTWQSDSGAVGSCVAALAVSLETVVPVVPVTPDVPVVPVVPVVQQQALRAEPRPAAAEEPAVHSGELSERVLRVTAQNLNRLLGLAGESLVESRWLQPFAGALQRLKRQHYELSKVLTQLRDALAAEELSEPVQAALVEAEARALGCRTSLLERLADFDAFERRLANLSHRMYDGALACRMRPFSDGTQAFPRMVRDVARSLGKQVRLEIDGSTTEVDRDILEKLDAPLGHLLRNAVDHGIEKPGERLAAGKPAEGVVRLEARHLGGRLNLVVRDDGAGISIEKLRAQILARNLASAETAAKLSETELYEFLLLPGFSLAQSVTDISGRGVGLDAVNDMLKQVRGTVRISSQENKGTRLELQLPLTRSLVRALLVEVSGEPYAIPLSSITRTVKVAPSEMAWLEGRMHFALDGKRVGVIAAHQLLQSAPPEAAPDEWSVLVLGAAERRYGLIVDRLLGERELVVQPLDTRLGKLKDISAAAQMEDGSPVLIIDVEDLLRSIERLIAAGSLTAIKQKSGASTTKERKRVLVVDDSLTVRELERKLLTNAGYEVEVAVDGMDGWNAVRNGDFDLIVTDIDMPRMDGIELVKLLRQDQRVKSVPVMIVSYKDRPEDRQRGLQAGADYYLAKSSFHDQTLLDAVADLIGVAAIA